MLAITTAAAEEDDDLWEAIKTEVYDERNL